MEETFGLSLSLSLSDRVLVPRSVSCARGAICRDMQRGQNYNDVCTTLRVPYKKAKEGRDQMRITRGYRKMQIFADADILHRFYPITDEKGGGQGAITFHLIWPPSLPSSRWRAIVMQASKPLLILAQT